MSDTQTVSRGRISDTKPTRVVLNLAVYRERAAALGAGSPAERRALIGISRTTEWRWIHGHSTPRSRSRAAAKLGTTTHELFAEVAA